MVFTAIRRSLRRRAIRKSVDRVRRSTIRDVMSTYMITIRPDETIVTAATKMVAETISCLVVVENERIAGIVTERDFLHKVPLSTDVFRMLVRDVMTPKVVTVSPQTPLVDAVRLMKEHNFRRLVVAEGDRLVGIVTQNDLSRLILREFSVYPAAGELALDTFMTTQILTASIKESFAKARQAMHKRNVGCILIVDKAKQVQGIFTEYDVVAQFYEQKGKIVVRELDAFMRKYVQAVPTGTNAFIATRFIIDRKIRRIPVVDGSRVSGIATETDLVRFLYLNLDRILAAAEKPGADLRRLSNDMEFTGEFRGDHLKVFVTT